MNDLREESSSFAAYFAGFELKLTDIIRQHAIAHEKFTEAQLAKCLREALLAGDFVRCVREDGKTQAVYYVPYCESESLKATNLKLARALAQVQLFCPGCGEVCLWQDAEEAMCGRDSSVWANTFSVRQPCPKCSKPLDLRATPATLTLP